MPETFTDRVERQAREACAAFLKWMNAAGWDNPEFQDVVDAMDALSVTLNVNVE